MGSLVVRMRRMMVKMKMRSEMAVIIRVAKASKRCQWTNDLKDSSLKTWPNKRYTTECTTERKNEGIMVNKSAESKG